MSDNPKLKKLDRKRVAISQKHELDYCKKIAHKLSEPFKFECDIEKRGRKRVLVLEWKEYRRLQGHGSKVIRLAKAFLLLVAKLPQHEKRIRKLEGKLSHYQQRDRDFIPEYQKP